MTARTNQTFQILLKLAGDEVDARAKELGFVTTEHNKAQRTLDLLEVHRSNSLKQLESVGASGVTICTLRNHQSFVSKLDHAITTQQTRVSSLQQAIANARKRLEEAERKRMGYDKLQERQQVSLRRITEKRDQKQMDEFAANSARRNLQSLDRFTS